MTYKEIQKNEVVNAYIQKGNDNLGVLGYTDHSSGHSSLVAERAASILTELGYDEHTVELAKIAGYMHDIGNAINRSRHAEYGALLADTILRDTDMSLEDRITVMSTIGNHDESTGTAVDAVSAAVIIADKTDVRRNRVRSNSGVNFDIHDQVNYAVTNAELLIDTEKKVITLNLTVDEEICTMYEYFEIFLGRMLLCKKAAGFFGLRFELIMNGQSMM